MYVPTDAHRTLTIAMGTMICNTPGKDSGSGHKIFRVVFKVDWKA